MKEQTATLARTRDTIDYMHLDKTCYTVATVGKRYRGGHAMAAELHAALEAARAKLLTAIADLNEETFRARPAPSSWTPAETLSHLLDTERFLTEHARAPSGVGERSVPSRSDDERQQGARRARSMPVPQIVHGLLAQRRDTLRLLDRMTAQELARPLRHQSWGARTVGWLFQRIAEHETEHAAQIHAARPRDVARAP